jgi:hypothetical protein
MGKEKADLIERIYNDRDNTSHEGRLFAYESSQGAFSALTLTPAIVNGESTALLVPNDGDRVHEFLQMGYPSERGSHKMWGLRFGADELAYEARRMA